MHLQVLDARDPLRYRSEDMEAYAAELSPPKPSLLLLNKSDLLHRDLRAAWADYFDTRGLDYVFWSAKAAADAAAESGAMAHAPHGWCCVQAASHLQSLAACHWQGCDCEKQ